MNANEARSLVEKHKLSLATPSVADIMGYVRSSASKGGSTLSYAISSTTSDTVVHNLIESLVHMGYVVKKLEERSNNEYLVLEISWA